MTELGFCRELNTSEPLAGTGADSITRWVLLEDCGPWGAKTPRDTTLPPAVIAWLQAREAEPNTRVLLIRRPGSSLGQLRRLIIAIAPADPSARRLIELDIELARLPALDLEPVIAAAQPGPESPESSPAMAALWLVCTHGTRDRCCAKWGMPLFEALRRRAPGRVWQCSHLGGHRFAPTFLTLPDGLMWGRFDLARLDALADALALGQLTELESLRGRCCYPRTAQAAECLIRAREGLVGDAALELVRHTAQLDGGAQVEFRTPSGDIQAAEVSPTPLDFVAPASCGDVAEPRVTLRLRPQSPTT